LVHVAQGLVDAVGTRVRGLEDIDHLAVGDAVGAEGMGAGLGTEADASTTRPWAVVALVNRSSRHHRGLEGRIRQGERADAYDGRLS
jgi:hypothetical protein